MKKSVLLTRAKEFNKEFNRDLREYGYEVLECNLIKYELLPIEAKIYDNYQHIIVTSFYAATQLPKKMGSVTYAWVVGKKSASLIEEKGYKIKYIATNVSDLKKNIPEDIYDNTIYLSGDNITSPMDSRIFHKVFYKVYYKEYLSKQEIFRYKENIDYILLYSENCAKTLVKLLLQNNLMNYLEDAMFIVISSKVEKIVKPYFKNTKIFSNSNLMLKFLVK